MSRVEEIRINGDYASKLIAQYETGDRSNPDAPAKIRRNLMRTDEYIQKFVSQFSTEGKEEILTPPNCRYIKSYPNNTTIAVIEEPPAMRSIRVRMDMTRDAEALKAKNQWKEFGYEKFFTENKKPYTFMLAVPYVIHILKFNGTRFNRGRVFFRPKPLLGMQDVLYRPPLLNVNNSMAVCYGESVSRGPGTSITAEADHVVRVFWSATFNPDYIDNYYAYSNVGGVCDYFTWQYYSQTDPMFIYNVDWIPTKSNISQYIEKMHRQSREPNALGFKTLSQVFEKPQATTKLVPVGKRGSVRPLIFDICNGWIPEPRLSVYIGDPINYSKDRIAFIDSFAGISGRSEPLYVRIKVEDDNGDKLVMIKINEKTKQFLADKIKEIRHEAYIELPDKSKLKPGDIITMKNKFGNEIYKKVHYIRRTADESLELRVGSEYWFADMVDWEKVVKLDVSNPQIDGISIQEKEVYYYYISGYYTPAPLGSIVDVKFDSLTIGDNNNLTALFYETSRNNQSHRISLSDIASRIKRIYTKSECEELPISFCVGRVIMSYTDESNIYSTVLRTPTFGILTSRYHRRVSRPPFDNLCRDFLSKDEQHFHAKSNNMDINFSVEDKVVVADWQDPLSVLSIKTIKAFVKNTDEAKISMMLEDKNGKPSTVTYVDGYDSTIMVGKVRRVTNELNGITIGTKIVAKETGIACFPKKDVNIIVAFIIDTGGEPLALCSNGCTLWFSDLIEKFELTKMKSRKWKTMTHAPLDPTKIKLQAGDIVNSTGYNRTNHGYLVVKNNNSGGIKFARLDCYHDYDEYGEGTPSFVKSLILDCIPNPRMTVPSQRRKGFVRGFPTFHGGISQTVARHSPYKFIDETGRF